MKVNITQHSINPKGVYTKLPDTLTINQDLFNKLNGNKLYWVRSRESGCLKNEHKSFKKHLFKNKQGYIWFAHLEPRCSDTIVTYKSFYIDPDDLTRQVPDWRRNCLAPCEAVSWEDQLNIYDKIKWV